MMPSWAGMRVPARPRIVIGTGSGTPSLREAKPDPMPAALAAGQPACMRHGVGSITPGVLKPDPYRGPTGTVSPTARQGGTVERAGGS